MTAHNATLNGSWTISAQIGRIWFRWRSFSPIPLFVMLFLLPSEFKCSIAQYGLLILGVFLAEGLRVWSVGHAGSNTRTRGETVNQLVHAGPYQFVRNPLYIANVAMYTFCGMIFGFGLLSFFIFIYSSLEYYFIVSFEEQVLSKTFGQSYLDYCEKVPRWVPSFKPACISSGHTFNLWRALKSEKSTFFSMTAMALGFFIKVLFLK
ncbi:MAG: isoprenylcysteine carboxylmethyltransferase family protein [Bdellovibrionales bacterium]|nr:isoprenylcysteine carboxylmethyltransferase family protein [Bdellovibrionales bacterium]